MHPVELGKGEVVYIREKTFARTFVKKARVMELADRGVRVKMEEAGDQRWALWKDLSRNHDGPWGRETFEVVRKKAEVIFNGIEIPLASPSKGGVNETFQLTEPPPPAPPIPSQEFIEARREADALALAPTAEVQAWAQKTQAEMQAAMVPSIDAIDSSVGAWAQMGRELLDQIAAQCKALDAQVTGVEFQIDKLESEAASLRQKRAALETRRKQIEQVWQAFGQQSDAA